MINIFKHLAKELDDNIKSSIIRSDIISLFDLITTLP